MNAVSTCEYILFQYTLTVLLEGFNKHCGLFYVSIFDAGLIGLSEAQKSPIANKRNDCLKSGS